MKHESFEKTAIAYVETLVERDALVELLKHPLLEGLPRIEGYPVLGSYILFAQLGKGGMANVFRGVHIRLENEVAIKVRTAPTGSAGARFQREATVAAQLEHQNLVRATDVDEAGGLQYMVLDYVDGEDADERVARKGPLGARETLTIVRDAALGLGEAHRLHFIHRDIKPANLMISRDGRVKVADLGLAKSVVHDDLGLTATGGILGTPMYMAPEQFRRAEETCKASDVYGLGASACFLLLGHHPFDGKSVPEIMQQVCVQGIQRMDEALPDLDSRVADVLAEAVALDVADRPANGAELAAKLTVVLEALGGPVPLADDAAGASKARGVKPPTPEARTKIKAAVTSAEPSGIASTLVQSVGGSVETDGEDPGRSGSKLGWFFAAALLAAGGGFGWMELQKKKADPDPDPGSEVTHQNATPAKSDAPGPETVMSPAPKVEEPISKFDPVAVGKASMTAEMHGEWSKGFIELHQHAQDAIEENRVDEIVKVVEGFSQAFQTAGRYQRTTEMLDEEGQAALLELAQNDELFLPVTAVIAAELALQFNGLTYEIDGSRRSVTDRLLKKAEVVAKGPVKARARLLQGVLLLNDYMADEKHRTDINGKRVQDHLTAAAEVTPDSEAAAWLGVLYLYSLDRAGSEEGVPVWFKESAMVELLTASLDEETASGDAAYVMGHLCSDGLAGVAPSLEQAKAYYTLGAKQEHIGCVGEALLRGAALEGMLNEALHDRMLRFTESDSDNAALQIQDAYALAALTHSFEGEEQAPARRERAREFLQQNVELGLRKGLKVDRDFDRLTLYLATVMTPLDGQTELTESQRESVRAWVLSQKEELCDEIFGDGIPPRSLPIWAHLLVLDPALAAEVADARNDEGDVARGVQAADFLRTKMIPEMTAEDYADSPFIWSKAEAAQAALANR